MTRARSMRGFTLLETVVGSVLALGAFVAIDMLVRARRARRLEASQSQDHIVIDLTKR